MTFAEKYEYLKQTYASHADFSAVSGDLAAEITLTDKDCGGTFYVARIGGKTSTGPYSYYDSTVRIRVESALLEALLNGKKNPVNEYLLGNLTAEGDPRHALQLIDALKRKPKKPR